MGFKPLPTILAFSLAVTRAASQQDFRYNTTRITAQDGGRLYGQFGRYIAMSDNTLAVTSRILPEGNISCSGKAVFIFVKDNNATWQQQARLTEEEICAHASFGKELALDGDTLVVGAPSETFFNDGAAFVFQRNATTWSLAKTLKPPADGSAGEQLFGSSVAVSNGRVAVGAPVAVREKATVFVYSDGAWNSPQRLERSVAVHSDWGALLPTFGSGGLTFDGELLVAVDLGGGAAYIFADDGTGFFVEQMQVVQEDGEFSAFFGNTVVMGNGFLAVSAHGHNDREGEISVFSSESPFPLVQTLRPNATYGAQRSFGWQMDMADGRLVTIADASPSWYLYVFDLDADTGLWIETAVLQLEDDDVDGDIAYSSLSTTATRIAVGDYLDSELGTQFGSVFMLETLLDETTLAPTSAPTSQSSSLRPSVAPTSASPTDVSTTKLPSASVHSSLISTSALLCILFSSFSM
jgi:hypothetical protein